MCASHARSQTCTCALMRTQTLGASDSFKGGNGKQTIYTKWFNGAQEDATVGIEAPPPGRPKKHGGQSRPLGGQDVHKKITL